MPHRDREADAQKYREIRTEIERLMHRDGEAAAQR